MALQIKLPNGTTKWVTTVMGSAMHRRREGKIVGFDRIDPTIAAEASEMAIDAKRSKAVAKAEVATAKAAENMVNRDRQK